MSIIRSFPIWNMSPPPKAAEPKEKKRSSRSKVAWWLFDLSWTGGTALLARKHWGASLGIAFLGWRAWSYFGVSSWVVYGYSWLETIVERVEQGKELYEEIGEMKKSGDLDLLLLVGGSCVLLLYILWWQFVAKKEGRSGDSDSEISVEEGTAVSDTDDDEPSPRQLFSSLMLQQERMIKEMSDLKANRQKEKEGERLLAPAVEEETEEIAEEQVLEKQVDRFLERLQRLPADS